MVWGLSHLAWLPCSVLTVPIVPPPHPPCWPALTLQRSDQASASLRLTELCWAVRFTGYVKHSQVLNPQFFHLVLTLLGQSEQLHWWPNVRILCLCTRTCNQTLPKPTSSNCARVFLQYTGQTNRTWGQMFLGMVQLRLKTLGTITTVNVSLQQHYGKI